MIEPRPYTFDRVIRIIFTVISVVGVFYVLNLLKNALLPFVAAWLLAYLLNPIVLFAQNKIRIRNRLLAIITTLLSLGLLLTVVGFALAPSIINEFDKTSEVVQSLSQSSRTASIIDKAWYQTLLDKINLEDIRSKLNPEEWNKLLEDTLPHIWSFLSGSINQIISIVSWFIVLLYLVFILLDYDKIQAGFKNLIPQKYKELILSIIAEVEIAMNRHFRYQSLIALIVGILFSIGFIIIGIPLAIPLGLFIGLLNLVPYLQIVGIIPTVLLCLLGTYNDPRSFWTLFGLSMVVFAVVQTIQDTYITPKIMGKATGLNPAVILLSLSIWGTLLGIMGMIIALPLTSLVLSYYQKYIINGHPQEIKSEASPEVDAAVDAKSESNPKTESDLQNQQ